MAIIVNDQNFNNNATITTSSVISLNSPSQSENLFININSSEKLICLVFWLTQINTKVQFNIEANCNVRIINIYQNEQLDIHYDVEYLIGQKAHAEIYNLNILGVKCVEKINFKLIADHSKVDFYLASLATKDFQKQINIITEHLAPQTTSNIKTYSIAKDKSLQEVKCVSDIHKGMHRSEAHQELRLLVFDKASRAISDPILLIDENDIVASHANAVGMLNPDELFYLQSRGLSQTAARQLICMGYFKPVIEAIENEQLQQQIIRQINQELGVENSDRY